MAICIIALLNSCKKDEGLISPPATGGELPSHFPEPIYPWEISKTGNARFVLGRKMFYDETLSLDSSISCSSCHKSMAAFSDPGRSISLGVEGRSGVRNAPALFNLAWKPSMLWDGGVVNLEFQPVAPITDTNEMHMQIKDVISRLQNNPEYPALFQNAFGSSEIKSQKMLLAFARFLSALVSAESAYDKYILGDEHALNANEKKGLELFRQNCNSCHTEPLFSDFSFRNNGIAVNAIDSGRVRITLLTQDRNKFQIPSLRNIGFSAPYMHDGRFNNLEEVINHYSSPQNYSPGADELLPQTELSMEEKEQLKAFLLSLSDYNFVNNQGFANPDYQ